MHRSIISPLDSIEPPHADDGIANDALHIRKRQKPAKPSPSDYQLHDTGTINLEPAIAAADGKLTY